MLSSSFCRQCHGDFHRDWTELLKSICTEPYGYFSHICKHLEGAEDILQRGTCTPLFGYQTIETIVPQGIGVCPRNLRLGEEKDQKWDDSQRRSLSLRKTFRTLLTCLTTLQKSLELRQWWVDDEGTTPWPGLLNFAFFFFCLSLNLESGP